MAEKRIIRVASSFDEHIIAMAPSSTIYTDQNFYETKLGENMDDPTYKSVPANIIALRIGWILTEPQGK